MEREGDYSAFFRKHAVKGNIPFLRLLPTHACQGIDVSANAFRIGYNTKNPQPVNFSSSC